MGRRPAGGLYHRQGPCYPPARTRQTSWWLWERVALARRRGSTRANAAMHGKGDIFPHARRGGVGDRPLVRNFSVPVENFDFALFCLSSQMEVIFFVCCREIGSLARPHFVSKDVFGSSGWKVQSDQQVGL